MRVVSDQPCPHDGENIDCIEFNRGACGQLLGELFDLSKASLLLFQDKIINLPRIILGASEEYAAKFRNLSGRLADALSSDFVAGKLERASVALSWTSHGAMTTISMAGKIEAVTALVRYIPSIVDPEQSAATWVDSLNARLKELAPIQSRTLDPSSLVTQDGRLSLLHRVDENLPAELLTVIVAENC